MSGSHAGLDAKLVNRVSRRKENDGVDQGFVVVNSIEDEIVVLGTQAIDGKGGAASFAVAEGFRVAACARRRGVGHAASDVGFESGELREIAAVEGQLGDLTALHDDTNGGIARQLWVTEKTVETHVSSILGKLGLPLDSDTHRRVLAVVTYLREKAQT